MKISIESTNKSFVPNRKVTIESTHDDPDLFELRELISSALIAAGFDPNLVAMMVTSGHEDWKELQNEKEKEESK